MHPQQDDWIDDGSPRAEWQRRARGRIRSHRRELLHRRTLNRIALAALAGGIALASLGWYFKDPLPPPASLLPPLLDEPVQRAISEPAFKATVDGVSYYVRPRYAYDIAGLVVSLHQSDAWWDTAHDDARDYLNLMDLCVVWGGNAASGIYRRVSFSNSEWSCDWSYPSSVDAAAFSLAQISNNHLLAADAHVAHLLKRIHKGDQVRLHGMLADYGVMHGSGIPDYLRVSSDTRLDTGNGACEIVYVTSVELLSTGGGTARFALTLGWLLMLGALVAWLLLPLAPVVHAEGGPPA